jgi:hypothetical protein
MAASLHANPNDADKSFGTGLVVGFFVLGFLCGYLYTRLILQGAFERSNQSVIRKRHFNAVVSGELSAAESTSTISDPRAAPTAAELQAAQRVFQAAPPDQLESVMKSVQSLAREYEQVRASMPSSPERTKAMSLVAKKMSVFGLAALPLIPRLTNSASPGERLAASVILRMRFDPNYIVWLGNQLSEEVPFLGFHAVQALLAGMMQCGPADRLEIQRVVRNAKMRLEASNNKDTHRDRRIDEILSMKVDSSPEDLT